MGGVGVGVLPRSDEKVGCGFWNISRSVYGCWEEKGLAMSCLFPGKSGWSGKVVC